MASDDIFVIIKSLNVVIKANSLHFVTTVMGKSKDKISV